MIEGKLLNEIIDDIERGEEGLKKKKAQENLQEH